MKCLIPIMHQKVQYNYINADTNTRTNIIYSRTTTPQTTLASKNRGMATAPRANILSICLTVGCKRLHTYVYLFTYIIYHLLQIIYFLNLPDGQLQKFDETDILTNSNMFFFTMKRGHESLDDHLEPNTKDPILNFFFRNDRFHRNKNISSKTVTIPQRPILKSFKE